jgi:hypothetical protein
MQSRALAAVQGDGTRRDAGNHTKLSTQPHTDDDMRKHQGISTLLRVITYTRTGTQHPHMPRRDLPNTGTVQIAWTDTDFPPPFLARPNHQTNPVRAWQSTHAVSSEYSSMKPPSNTKGDLLGYFCLSSCTAPVPQQGATRLQQSTHHRMGLHTS